MKIQKLLKSILVLTIGTMTLTSCSKKDDSDTTPPQSEYKEVKYTISINGDLSANTDHIEIRYSGISKNGYPKDKEGYDDTSVHYYINNEESTYHFNNLSLDDFKNNPTIVIKSAQPLKANILNFNIIKNQIPSENPNNNTGEIVLSYTIEVNGKETVNVKNYKITNTEKTYTKSYEL